MKTIELSIVLALSVLEILKFLGIFALVILGILLVLAHKTNANRNRRFCDASNSISRNESILSKFKIKIKDLYKEDNFISLQNIGIFQKKWSKMIALNEQEKIKRIKSLLLSKKRFFLSNVLLFIGLVLFIIAMIFTKPSDGWKHYISLLIIFICFVNFFIAYSQRNKAHRLIHVYRIILIENIGRLLIWQNTEKEFELQTLAINTKDKVIMIENIKLEDLITNQLSNAIIKFKLDEIDEWNTNIVINKYTPTQYFSEQDGIHKFIMTYVRAFYTITDPYSHISRTKITFLKSIKLTIRLKNGNNYVFEVLPNHFNYRYAISGSEDFEMNEKKFWRFINLLEISGFLFDNLKENGEICECYSEYVI